MPPFCASWRYQTLSRRFHIHQASGMEKRTKCRTKEIFIIPGIRSISPPCSFPDPALPLSSLSFPIHQKNPSRRCYSYSWAHFFLAPPFFESVAFLSTLFTTPTATVCRMSRTAKRPRGGYSVKDSTTMGLEGSKVT